MKVDYHDPNLPGSAFFYIHNVVLQSECVSFA